MRPAEGKSDLLAPFDERSVRAMAIDLQDACEPAEMRFEPLRLAIAGVDIGHHRRIDAAPWPVIAGVGPQLARLRPAASPDRAPAR